LHIDVCKLCIPAIKHDEPAKLNINTSRSNKKNKSEVNIKDSVNDSTFDFVVRGGKSSGEQLTIVPDEQGSFELSSLEKGVYEFSLANSSRAEAKDFNTTRNNRENRLVTNLDNPFDNMIMRVGKYPGDSATTLFVGVILMKT
jgi:hypothetical protein